MAQRFVSGVVGLPLLVLVVFAGNGLPFAITIVLLSVLGLIEFYRGVKMTGANPQEWVGYVFVGVFVFLATNHYHSKGFATTGIMTLLVLITMTIELARTNRDPIRDIGSTFLGVVYPVWLFSYLAALRYLPGDVKLHWLPWNIPLGAYMVFFVVFSAWSSDTTAYLIGRKWGKNKLAPSLSPGKSWEGGIAGIVACCIVSGLFSWGLHIDWMLIPIIGVGIAISSLFGDLAKSSIKRSIGIKDFGTILPGHGGVLDRFDGLLFAGPLFYYFCTMVLQY
jgi:phosphatidate cytidylyltransferase